MLPKDIKTSTEAREQILIGVDIIANAVKATLGPRGRNVMIDKGQHQAPRITKDGVTVAKEIMLKNRFQNMGAQTLREVASKAADKSGDGTTTATVLAQAIFREGNKAVAAGMNPIDLKRGIDKAVATVVESLKEKSKPVTTKDEWQQVATISANGDTEVGEKIADAIEKVGKEGVVTVEEAKGLEFELDIVEGMQFDRGYLSPYFITNNDKMTVEFENPLILILDKRIEKIEPIIPLLEMAVQQTRPLLIIADDVVDQALALLIVNKIRGGMQVCAVRAPAFADRRKEYLNDIAILTGGEVLNDDLLRPENATSNVFGRATKVRVNKEETLIIGGMGDKAKIDERCVQIRGLIEETKSDFDREKQKERLAKLTSGVAVLKVGGSSEIEVKERRDRVDDALHATRAAVEEGIVPGGGTALLYASRDLDGMKGSNEDQTTGIAIVRRAIQAPLRQIMENAGVDGAVIAGKLLESQDTDKGYDAQELKYCDMIACGIIDPTKVVRCALQDAASVAGLLITTEVLITDVVDENKTNNGQPTQG